MDCVNVYFSWCVTWVKTKTFESLHLRFRGRELNAHAQEPGELPQLGGLSPGLPVCFSPGHRSGSGIGGGGARARRSRNKGVKPYHSVNFDDTVRVTDRTNFQLRENRAMNVYHGSSSSTRPSPFSVVWDDTLYIAVLFYNFSTTTTP